MQLSDLDYVFSAIDELRNIYNDRHTIIQLFGGEPLLPTTKNFVEDFLGEAGKRELPVGIVTNGSFAILFIDILKKFKETIKSVQVTIDGPPSIHNKRRKLANGRGTFDIIIDSVNALLSIGIEVSARINIDSQNIDYVPELLKMFDDNGWSGDKNFSSSMSPVQDHSQSGAYDHYVSENVLLTKILKLMETRPEIERVFS
ncbi:MAG: 4Fe-4S cluster-binding domain-containing protein, partial [Rubrobacteridae bacterium]|nr:4Fe-4S cluster-binding domain-containing protein [Rubrobacteridae bacterium]